MGERTQALAQHLFGKNSLEECDLSEIESLAARFPYFAPAQFLLLQKLKSTGSDQYQRQLEKAILYYHNPLEFQYIIDSERFEAVLPVEDVFIHQPVDEPQIPEENVVTEDDHATEDTVIADEIIESENEETAEPTTEIVTAAANETPEFSHGPSIADASDVNHIEEPSQNEVEEIEEAEAIAEEENDIEIEQEISLPDDGLPKHSVFARIAKEAEAEPVNNITFEPYHAVDYFASQGIKLSLDETGTDTFGKQLKSFTEWLKTMKRLPATQISVNIDSTSEHKVQHMAQHSINEADVFTEAMAEVWAKQGNREKAEEVYNKLSLLYPSKKTYFAAKIDNLKH